MSANSSAPGPLSPPLGWSGDATRIAKTYRFGSFAQAISFMVEVSFFCEKADHHPEWRNVYDRVFVELTTHDVGRVTEKDLELARHMEGVHALLTGGVPGSSH